MQLVVGRLAVPVDCLAPADTRVLLLNQLMEPTQAGVSVGVDNFLEGGVPIFEGQHLAGSLLAPVVLVRVHELARRLAEPSPAVACTHPRELLLHQCTVDVVQTLICVHPFVVEKRCLHLVFTYRLTIQKCASYAVRVVPGRTYPHEQTHFFCAT